MNFRKLKDKIDGKFIKAGIMLGVACSTFLDTATVYAKDDKVFDFLKEGTGKDNDAFGKLTETVEQTGFSLYNLMMVVGILGLVCAVIVLGLSHALTKNTTKKSENKSHIVDICIGAILIFGAMSLIGLIKTIADKI